jgi:hypothetical protein
MFASNMVWLSHLDFIVAVLVGWLGFLLALGLAAIVVDRWLQRRRKTRKALARWRSRAARSGRHTVQGSLTAVARRGVLP